MKRVPTILALLCTMAVASTTHADSTVEVEYIRERALAGIRLSINDQFRSADSVFAELTAAIPSSPYGPLFAAGNLQAEMLDKESDEGAIRFIELVTAAETNTKNTIATRGVSTAEDEFVLGVAAGYRAVYESRWGGWFAALKSGLRAKKHFERALALDSTLCDAYLGLGSYHYWKSAKTDWVNWLPVVADSRKKGFSMLERAISCGFFTHDAARAALAAAYVNEGLYQDAIAHADTLSTRNPFGKTPLWIKGKAFHALYEWDSTISVFDSLESLIRSEGAGNYFNLIECAYYRAHSHWGSGHYRKALEECGRALTYPATADAKKRQRQRLNELRTMQRRLVKLLAR